jgi:hypothetical protein
MDGDVKPAEALRKRAKEERRLLRAEQEAERALLVARERLATAQVRLEKAQARVERRRERVAKTLAELRQRQEERAAGPDGVAALTTKEEAAPEIAPDPIPVRDDSSAPSEAETAPVAAVNETTSDTQQARPTRRKRTAPPAVPA